MSQAEPTTQLPRLMGIVNATGDSFSEGAESRPETAVSRAEQLLLAPCDLLDLGGESTRPGSEVISPEVETARLLPLVKALKARHPDVTLSCDTRNSATAQAVLDVAANCWINDVSMLRNDIRLAEIAAKYRTHLVLCHSRGTPQDMRDARYCDYGSDVCGTIIAELAAAAEKAEKLGVERNMIIFDPGFGFAKTVEQQVLMLKELSRFKALGPLLIGVSRKSFLGALCGESQPQQRIGATLAAELAAAARGADIIRTHQPGQLRQALLIQRSLL